MSTSDVVGSGAHRLAGGRFGSVTARLWLLDGGALDFFLGSMKLGFELLTGFFELTHAFAEAAREHGKFLGSEKDEDQNADDDQLRGSKGAETGKDRGDVHEDSHTL